MSLQQYIKELLYQHECVTVPNFGAFLTRSVPVLIHPDTDVFSPPKKEVSFNSLLKSNDGILANYMAKKEKVSYEQALRKIEREVIVWKQRLNTQHLNFAGIGEMQLNPHKRISFSPYGSINFDLSSFGLGRFTRKAIHPLKINESPKSPNIINNMLCNESAMDSNCFTSLPNDKCWAKLNANTIPNIKNKIPKISSLAIVLIIAAICIPYGSPRLLNVSNN